MSKIASTMSDGSTRPIEIGMVSGWSYSESVFDPLRRELPNVSTVAYDWSCFAAQWLDDAPQGARPEPDAWLGWSLGGALLLEALRRGRIAPERLILLNATPRFLDAPGWRGVPEPEWRALRRAVVRDPEPAVSAFRRRFELPNPVDGSSRRAELADVSGLDWLARLDLRSWLQEVATPVECWLAPDDPLVPADWPSRLALSLQVRCHRLPGRGHASWWHRPAELAARLSDR
ncbi:MAG: alpha/beta fold hydrolase [Halothiobacillaceae bacterium]|nr:alpha/beta fold hydrolase [Halothiobacillaceae bacterium]